jgi:hypothetical protein
MKGTQKNRQTIANQEEQEATKEAASGESKTQSAS